MNRRKRGDFYEDIAAKYLEENGISIIERNYRCKMGEIDIIGSDRETIVFFEVKYRKDNSFGNPLEAIDIRKQRRIISAAKYYLTYKNNEKYIRFDAIGILGNEIEWIKNAFCL